jgi:hypothetical protein
VVFEIMVIIMKINVGEESCFDVYISLWFRLDKAFSFVTEMIP